MGTSASSFRARALLGSAVVVVVGVRSGRGAMVGSLLGLREEAVHLLQIHRLRHHFQLHHFLVFFLFLFVL